MDNELKALIEKSRSYRMTPEQREAQQISFAYGNAKLHNPNVTRRGIIRASRSIKDSQNRPDDEV